MVWIHFSSPKYRKNLLGKVSKAKWNAEKNWGFRHGPHAENWQSCGTHWWEHGLSLSPQGHQCLLNIKVCKIGWINIWGQRKPEFCKRNLLSKNFVMYHCIILYHALISYSFVEPVGRKWNRSASLSSSWGPRLGRTCFRVRLGTSLGFETLLILRGEDELKIQVPGTQTCIGVSRYLHLCSPMCFMLWTQSGEDQMNFVVQKRLPSSKITLKGLQKKMNRCNKWPLSQASWARLTRRSNSHENSTFWEVWSGSDDIKPIVIGRYPKSKAASCSFQVTLKRK